MKNLVLNKAKTPKASFLRSLLLLLLPLPLLFSCSLILFPGYHPKPEARPVKSVSWFQGDSGHFLFSAKIDLMKRHFSGLMVVKSFPDESYRVVFITEVGLKIFDMEFLPDGQVKVHYIMDAMNRKTLIKTFSKDISLVLMNGLSAIQPDVLGQKHSQDIIFRYRTGSVKNYYHLDGSIDNPYRARQTGCVAGKIRAELYGSPVSGIDSIKIKHDNLRLTIDMYRINEIANVAE